RVLGDEQVDHQDRAARREQEYLRVRHQHDGKIAHSLLAARCRRRSLTEACMISVNGAGYTPIHSTATASRPRTSSSRRQASVSSATCLFPTSPKITRLYIHRVYAAPKTSVVAAMSAIQKLNRIAPMITMNSPTKPEVAGRPQFAIANSIISAANFGMVFTTPP